MSRHSHFEGSPLEEGEVDDACAAFQPGHGGRGASDAVAEVGEGPGAVCPAEADQGSYLALGGQLACLRAGPERVDGHGVPPTRHN
ncbi:hypothetical protein GCM10018780_92940 [Streptomyces lanatus]|nr:hypothetical protein GCM10018780_92940 [Streptomyces lanatus]